VTWLHDRGRSGMSHTKHNWLHCPIDVLELKSLVGKLGLGMEQKVVLPGDETKPFAADLR